MSSLPVTHQPKWPLSLASSWPLQLAFSASRIILLAVGLGKQLSNTTAAAETSNSSNQWLQPLLCPSPLASAFPIWPQNSPRVLYLNQQNQFLAKEGPINDSTLLRPMAHALDIGGFRLLDSASVWTQHIHTMRIYFGLGYKSRSRINVFGLCNHSPNIVILHVSFRSPTLANIICM